MVRITILPHLVSRYQADFIYFLSRTKAFLEPTVPQCLVIKIWPLSSTRSVRLHRKTILLGVLHGPGTYL